MNLQFIKLFKKEVNEFNRMLQLEQTQYTFNYSQQMEVKCDETWAYYNGYVATFDDQSQQFLIHYEWKPDQWVAQHYIRPLPNTKHPLWRPQIGERVECMAKAGEEEPYGWWNCTVKGVEDNLYLITYDGWEDDENLHDQVEVNVLRPRNDKALNIQTYKDYIKHISKATTHITSK
eukprot:166684_1